MCKNTLMNYRAAMISSKKHTYARSFSELSVGDRFLVKSKDWYESTKDAAGEILGGTGSYCFCSGMSEYCGQWLTVHYKTCDIENSVEAVEDQHEHAWCDWMVEW